MKIHRFVRQFLLVLCLSVMTAVAFCSGAGGKRRVSTTVGQVGKDVMWIPTAQALADKMLKLAQVTPQDYVIDLGSGDGRIVITAAKRGARALGIEYNPDLVELSKRNAAREGVGDKARFIEADLFESDFSPATVITMFLLPELNLQLRPAILDLKPGTRIVSNSFDMGEWTGRSDRCRGPGGGLRQRLLPSLSLDRAGQSRRHVETSPRRARTQAELPDGLRRVACRCGPSAHRRWPSVRRPDQLQDRRRPLHRACHRRHHGGDIPIG